jgi:hypothetical protein
MDRQPLQRKKLAWSRAVEKFDPMATAGLSFHAEARLRLTSHGAE